MNIFMNILTKRYVSYIAYSLLYLLSLHHELGAKLVKLIKIDPTIKLDIRYATANNFTGVPVYTVAECYLEEGAAQALQAAQKEFLDLGLSLKVFDGYRPLSVQKIFWNLVPDERYVANPAKGSRHNRGCAVDVTLVDTKTGKELEMGSEFDDFTEKAHRTSMNFPAHILTNRKLLEHIMHKHGFIGWVNEWWHFDFNGWQDYPIRDISFEELSKQ